MTETLTTSALTADRFAPYGDVLEAVGEPTKWINQGMCGRHHDLAKMDFSDGKAGISFFNAQPRPLPGKVDLVERHPDGSQAFIPLLQTSFLVVVADDDNGTPVNLQAFLTKPGQGINLYRNVWHGVLSPLEAPGLFAVIDRIGDGPNLEEFWFETPIGVEAGEEKST
ncbi:ureidoglycolate lyase [Aliiroseovarius sp. YM-037]|uniref:ureidoglycolate lyase n=1 Tax=Aliiroseovarius sp. YM-037 TaxID=3341728 RepID=UPI003A7FC207